MPDFENEDTALVDSGSFSQPKGVKKTLELEQPDSSDLPTAAGIDEEVPVPAPAPRFRAESAAAAQKLPWGLFGATLVLWLLTVLVLGTKLNRVTQAAEADTAELGKLEARNKTLLDKVAGVEELEQKKESLEKELEASRERVRTLETARANAAAAAPAKKPAAKAPVPAKKKPTKRR